MEKMPQAMADVGRFKSLMDSWSTEHMSLIESGLSPSELPATAAEVQEELNSD